jgi:hypothetical protein
MYLYILPLCTHASARKEEGAMEKIKLVEAVLAIVSAVISTVKAVIRFISQRSKKKLKSATSVA